MASRGCFPEPVPLLGGFLSGMSAIMSAIVRDLIA
jgi:hypothetical protein